MMDVGEDRAMGDLYCTSAKDDKVLMALLVYKPCGVKVGINEIYVLWKPSPDWLPITFRMTVVKD